MGLQKNEARQTVSRQPSAMPGRRAQLLCRWLETVNMLFFFSRKCQGLKLSVRKTNVPTVLRMDEGGNWQHQDYSEMYETRRVPDVHTWQLEDADIWELWIFFCLYLYKGKNKVDIFICCILFHHNKFYLIWFQTNLTRKQLQKYWLTWTSIISKWFNVVLWQC